MFDHEAYANVFTVHDDPPPITRGDLQNIPTIVVEEAQDILTIVVEEAQDIPTIVIGDAIPEGATTSIDVVDHDTS